MCGSTTPSYENFGSAFSCSMQGTMRSNSTEKDRLSREGETAARGVSCVGCLVQYESDRMELKIESFIEMSVRPAQ